MCRIRSHANKQIPVKLPGVSAPEALVLSPKTKVVGEFSSPLSSPHATSEADTPGPHITPSVPGVQTVEIAGVPFAPPKQPAGLATKHPFNAYPRVNTSKPVRTTLDNHGRGLSPSASESDGDNSFTELPQHRQRKDMFGVFDPAAPTFDPTDPFPSIPLLAMSKGPMIATGPQVLAPHHLRPPNIPRPSSAPDNPSISTVEPTTARASSAPGISRDSSVLSNQPDVVIEQSADLVVVPRVHDPRTQPIGRSKFIAGGRPFKMNVDTYQGVRSKQVFDRYLATPSIFVNSPNSPRTPGSGLLVLPPFAQSRDRIPSQRSSTSSSSRVQQFGLGSARSRSPAPSSSRMPATSTSASSPSRVQRVPRSSGGVPSPTQSIDEDLFMDTFTMDDIDSQPEDNELGPVPGSSSPTRAAQTPTHHLSGPQKAKAPWRNTYPGPSGEAGRPPASVNEEVERVGHRIQAELVELAETLGLSYRTLLRKIGLGSQQEVRMPNLANMFRKVHKHRLLASNERV